MSPVAAFMFPKERTITTEAIEPIKLIYVLSGPFVKRNSVSFSVLY